MDTDQTTDPRALQRKLENLRQVYHDQNQFIRKLISHSNSLHDALQETVVHILSPGPCGSTAALEHALRLLDGEIVASEGT